MTKEEIQRLYKEKILPENNEPFHFEKEENAREVVQAYNPMCGDKYQIYLGKKTAHFDGFGCAISKASTSLLLRNMEGKSEDQVRELCEQFLNAFETGDGSGLAEELQILVELKNFEGRLDCIQLSWKAVLDYLNYRDVF